MYPAPFFRRSSGHSSATNVPPIDHSPPMPTPASSRNTASDHTLVATAPRKVKSEQHAERGHEHEGIDERVHAVERPSAPRGPEAADLVARERRGHGRAASLLRGPYFRTRAGGSPTTRRGSPSPRRSAAAVRLASASGAPPARAD